MKRPYNMTWKNYEKIGETYKDYRVLLRRWIEVKNCQKNSHEFCVRNRNPLFDITQCKFFNSGLGSELGLFRTKKVMDHYIQRTKAVRIIFNELEKNPNMGVEKFTYLLKKYCSTVALTEEEHQKVTNYCKLNPYLYNYEAYEKCGIKIPGLKRFFESDQEIIW